MKTIRISGIIANTELSNESNVTPATLAKTLEEANGESLLITINSPGGLVHPGMEMFSMIRAYPGNVEMRIVSFAASMGSVLALAGNKKTAESTAMYYIHNAQGFSIGDYRDLRKDAQYLEDYSQLIADLYVEHLNFTVEEARAAMDEDSQYFGDSLKALGFEIVDTGEAFNPATARIKNKEALASVAEKITKENREEDYEAVAALVGQRKSVKLTAVKTAVKNKKTASAEKTEVSKVENLKDLEAKYPDLYAEAVKVGTEAEKKRVSAHLTMGEAANAPDLAIKNIESGVDLTQDISAEYMAEGMKKADTENRQADTDDVSDTDGAGDSDDPSDEETEALAKKVSGMIDGKKKRGAK